LVDAGIPRPDAEVYSEGVRRGGTLVTVRSDDDMAQTAADIMSRYNVVDIDTRGDEYRSSGWKYDDNAQPYTGDQVDTFRTTAATTASTTPIDTTRTAATTASTTPIDTTRTADTTNRTLGAGESEVLPVVEEELQVGKRQVQRGGARIHTYVTERPVEEQVNLHEERVNVERRPVNREATDADLNAFQDRTIEVTETAEEPVVAKRARVVEEVAVNKEATDRTETVRDTVRRQDVDVEQIDAGTTTTERAVGSTGFDAYNTDFRNHYQQNYASSGMDYDAYGPVYRYGYGLANDSRYSNQDWNTIEYDVRTRWEDRNPGTWEQFKDGIHYAWDKARGRA
jgi:uncharacterized protein (TIGR02271 family)